MPSFFAMLGVLTCMGAAIAVGLGCCWAVCTLWDLDRRCCALEARVARLGTKK